MKYLAIAIVSAALGVATALSVGKEDIAPDQRAPSQEVASPRDSLAVLNEQVARSRKRQPAPTEEGVQRIPGRAGYDPTLLSSLFDLDSRDIYEAEPIVEEFAGPRSSFIHGALQRDLSSEFPDARIENIDCRTSSCRIEISGPLAQARELYSFIQTPPFGDVQQPQMARDTDTGIVTIGMVVLFSADNRDHAGYEQLYRERRHSILSSMRAAGRKVREP